MGDFLANTVDRTKDIPQVVQGMVFESRDDIATWAKPVPNGGWDADWGDARTASTWRNLLESERDFTSSAYLMRRARRLNALVPYSL